MASLLGRISALFAKPGDELPMLEDLETTPRERSRSMFRPFARREVAAAPSAESLTVLTDLLVSMREAIERQGARHEELMSYLSHLPKAMEMLPENSRLQAEALAAIRQHLENQGIQSRQLSQVVEKVGQASVEQRRLLETVRQRLDTQGENDQKIADHLAGFTSAMATSSETTLKAGELLKMLEGNLRERDQAFERVIVTHQRRHTVLMVASVVLSSAALIASFVGLLLVSK